MIAQRAFFEDWRPAGMARIAPSIAFPRSPSLLRRSKTSGCEGRIAATKANACAIASLIIPGLGQFISRRPGMGFFFLLGAIAVWSIPGDTFWPIALAHVSAFVNAWLAE